jgi:tyrosyl-tRNA synthetase
MSIPDSLIIDYFDLVTDVSEEELTLFKKQLSQESFNPMELKKKLAFELVRQFHGSEKAAAANENFTNVFQKRQAPDEENIVTIGTGGTISMELAKAGLVKSRAEAKRLLTQGGIEVDGAKITEDLEMSRIKQGSIIKVGKRRFATT